LRTLQIVVADQKAKRDGKHLERVSLLLVAGWHALPTRVAVAAHYWLCASWMETATWGFTSATATHHHSRQQALGVFLCPFTCLCHCSQTSLTSHPSSFLTCTRVCSGWDVRSTAEGWVQDGVAGCRPHQVSPERPPRSMACVCAYWYSVHGRRAWRSCVPHLR
jgi:hypothetical protein